MKETYEPMEIEVIIFDSEDVITIGDAKTESITNSHLWNRK